jgi:hypothetical protein
MRAMSAVAIIGSYKCGADLDDVERFRITPDALSKARDQPLCCCGIGGPLFAGVVPDSLKRIISYDLRQKRN